MNTVRSIPQIGLTSVSGDSKLSPVFTSCAICTHASQYTCHLEVQGSVFLLYKELDDIVGFVDHIWSLLHILLTYLFYSP